MKKYIVLLVVIILTGASSAWAQSDAVSGTYIHDNNYILDFSGNSFSGLWGGSAISGTFTVFGNVLIINATSGILSPNSPSSERFTISPNFIQDSFGDVWTRAGAGTTAPQGQAQNPAPLAYQIGDQGPAGGTIFYDKGSHSDGWRYLEVAPLSTEFQNVQWQASGLTTSRDILGTSNDLGTGMQNTRLISNQYRALGLSGSAAQLCDNLVHGGYDDWFLPSAEEFNLLWRNVGLTGLDVFLGSRFWTSSQASPGYALIGFLSGSDRFRDAVDMGYYHDKSSRANARAIRQF